MSRFKPLTQPSQAVLFLALLMIATFGAACGGATRNGASSSSTSASSSSSAPGGGAFEGEITSKTFISDRTMETRYAIKGARNRMETHFPQGGAKAGVMQASVTLMDFSSGTATMLFPQTKTYTTMNWGEMAEEMTKGAGKGFPIDLPKVASTGKTETIAGITCEHWLFSGKVDMCMAKGLGYASPEFAKFDKGGAFPLKMVNVENGQSKTIMEVTGVERKSLDDSIFTVPADYKKTEIPGMPGVPAGKK